MEEFEETIDLVHAANQGNADSLERLLERYRPRIQRIVALRMGKRLEEAVDDEDLVQETLIAVFRGLKTFEARTPGSFRHWLAKLIENEIRDRARHMSAQKRGKGREQRFADMESSSVLADSVLAGGGPTPSQVVDRNDMEARLHEKLLGLEEHYRKIIDLRQLCGMSYEEITREMNLPNQDAARAMFSRAMAKFSLQVAREIKSEP